MIEVIFNDNFLKSVYHLPKSQQKKLGHLIEILKINPFHPLLHTKNLSGELAGFWVKEKLVCFFIPNIYEKT